jgi:hypothetical protein
VLNTSQWKSAIEAAGLAEVITSLQLLRAAVTAVAVGPVDARAGMSGPIVLPYRTKKADRSPLLRLLSNTYFFISISFLQSAFILSSAFAGSIFAHFSVISAFSLSDIAPPWDPAKAPIEAIAKAETISVEINLFIFNILRINR